MPVDRPPTLAADEVHVWRSRLDAADVSACLATLDDAERTRAARYRFAAPRRHFCVARGTLRRLLGAYLDTDPRAIVLDYGEHGKPRLQTPAGDLRFNVSHSGGVVLLAFGRGRDVGVDVERTEREVDWEAVARRFFSPRELEALRGLPGAARRAAFFRGWTRKEAFIKATGRGVAFGLGNFAVTLRPGEGAALDWIRDGDPTAWHLVDTEPGDGYAGALCAAGADWRLRCWQAD